MAWLDILKLAKSPIQQAYEKYKPTVAEALGKGQEFIDRTSGYSALPEEARRAVDMAVDYSPFGGTIIGKSAKGWAWAEGKFSNMLDKMERAEISDAKSLINSDAIKKGLDENLKQGNTSAEFRLGDVFYHSKLFQQYPELLDTRLIFSPFKHGEAGSFYKDIDGTPIIEINRNILDREPLDSKQTLLHEIQHAIQEKEGFARGGSPRYWNNDTLKMYQEALEIKKLAQEQGKEVGEALDYYKSIGLDSPSAEVASIAHTKPIEQIEKVVKDLEKQKYEQGYEGYIRLGGEIESRSVDRRSNIPQEQLKYSQPYAGENIPLKEWIKAEEFLDQ